MKLLLPIFLVYLLSGCATAVKQPGMSLSENKVCLDAHPIEASTAYENFLQSSKSETAKLVYLLDRIKEAPDVAYYYEGNKYGPQNAYMAGNWILWRGYKKGEDAKSFLHRQLSRFPSQKVSIKFPDGLKYVAFSVFLNELELLDQTYLRNQQTRQ